MRFTRKATHRRDAEGLTDTDPRAAPCPLIVQEFIMNAKQISIATLIALASSVALADDITIDTVQHKSLKSRADVTAEVVAARAQGQLFTGGEVLPAARAISSKSRDAVRAEVVAARAAGKLYVGGEMGAGE
jgi:Domain of unknown function (DUF4148)